MTKNIFEIKMKNHEQEFNLLMDKIRKDVILFEESNPKVTERQSMMMYDLNVTTHFVGNICVSGAWIIDKINGNLNKKKGLKYKIRKALGFTYP